SPSSPSRPPRTPPQSARRSPLDQARAHEYGRGVPRDYRVAARIFGEQCRDGCGDMAACREYLRLARQDRGLPIDGSAYAKLLGTMCDRGSMSGCLVAALIGVRPRDKMPSTSGNAIRAACERGDAEACDLLAFNQLPGSGAEHDRRDMNARACGAGLVSACGD